jgi:hypothetical protein
MLALAYDDQNGLSVTTCRPQPVRHDQPFRNTLTRLRTDVDDPSIEDGRYGLEPLQLSRTPDQNVPTVLTAGSEANGRKGADHATLIAA